MLDAGRIALLQRLLQTAVDDLSRAVSATWSDARLRTQLVHACLDSGYFVVEAEVRGSPARARRGPRAARKADLQALLRQHDERWLAVDLLTGRADLHAEPRDGRRDDARDAARDDARDEASTLSLAAVHDALKRVSSGEIDALLISADALSYQRLFEPDAAAGRATQQRWHAVTSALPRSPSAARDKMHTSTWGDTTLTAVRRDVQAFGIARVACAVYTLPY